MSMIEINGVFFFSHVTSGVETTTPLKYITGIQFNDAANLTTVKLIDGVTVPIETTTNSLYLYFTKVLANYYR